MSATDSDGVRKSGRLPVGISGRVPSERVADLRRNQWPDWVGKRIHTLKDVLEAHTRVEETHLYPILRGNQKTQPLVEESLKEQREAARLLDELERLPMDHVAWIRTCSQLQLDVEHHAQEEEEELFPKARQILSEEKARKMAERMKEYKEELMTKT